LKGRFIAGRYWRQPDQMRNVLPQLDHLVGERKHLEGREAG
jgi:hypothetical protein